MKDNFVILDIETNVPENIQEDHFHVIQIGATKITNGDFKNYKPFNSFIRPVDMIEYPSGGSVLTDFIKQLTKIRQDQVDNAEVFEVVWDNFLKFCDPYFEFFVSWGLYDWTVLKRVCDYYGLSFPFRYHVNIKNYYKAYFDNTGVRLGASVKSASKYFDLPFNEEGQHNGFEDAKMITAIAEKMVEGGFYTFKKSYFEFKEGLITPCNISNYLVSPVLIKKYKEIQKKGKEMEQYLWSVK